MFTASAAGTAIVTATIEDGAGVGTDYTQNFNITVIHPVGGITGVPETAAAGVGLNLSGTVNPPQATNRTIVWSISGEDDGTTESTINGNVLNAAAEGTVTVTATITNGLAMGTDYTQDFDITVIQPVTNITDVPDAAAVGTGLNLSGTIVPSNATNQTIVWNVTNAGTSGAAIDGNVLSATAAGTAIISATIEDGSAIGTDYTQYFSITVIQPVTNIINVPDAAVVGTDLNLSGTVVPSTATHRTIDRREHKRQYTECHSRRDSHGYSHDCQRRGNGRKLCPELCNYGNKTGGGNN
jgi:endo-1,4-beta-xylanase